MIHKWFIILVYTSYRYTYISPGTGTFGWKCSGLGHEYIDSPLVGLPVLSPPRYHSIDPDKSGVLRLIQPFDLCDGYTPLQDGGWDVTEHFRSYDGNAIMQWMSLHYDKVKRPVDGMEKLNKENVSNLAPSKLSSTENASKAVPKIDDSGLFSVDFACDSGELQAILSSNHAPRYRDAEPVEIMASKYKGLIFLKVSPRSEGVLNDSKNRNSYSGLRFEELMTGKRDMSATGRDPKLNFNDSSCYNMVLKANVGSYRLVFSSEADCVQFSSSSGGDGKLPIVKDIVELKTVTARSLYRGENCDYRDTFRKSRTLKLWSQMVVCGVDTIEVGIKNDQIQVERIQGFKLNQLIDLRLDWDPEERFKFLNNFLDCVKETLTQDNDPSVVYKFTIRDGHIREPLKTIVSEEDRIIKKETIERFDRLSG